MKQYKILSGDNREEFSNWVNQHLREGWELCGGLAVDFEGHHCFYQAVTLTKPE